MDKQEDAFMDTIRVLIGILGLDQHEVGAIGVSRMLRDAGIEVIYTGRFNVPGMILATAIQEDVDVIGLSCHSWEYLYYVPELIQLLQDKNVSIPVIVGGSVITPKDGERLSQMGVVASFGPSSTEPEILKTVREIAALDH